MTWSYSQSTGKLRHDGVMVTIGYSGNGKGLNNPNDQAIHYVGPIPQGLWDIGAMAADGGHMGPNVLPLTPAAGTDTFGRDAFFIHGDNDKVNHTASEGCIIIRPDIRDQIAQSGDAVLEVTA